MLISITLVGRMVPGFNSLTDEVSRAFRAKVTTAMIDLPVLRSYRAARRQHDAEILLRELCPLSNPADIHLFIFREDMFAGSFNFVFGLSEGNCCVVSTERLDPRYYGVAGMASALPLFRERLGKEAVHEIGHCLGLAHCEDKGCVMVFSEDIVGVDRKGVDFCSRCAREMALKIKGR
jgi:archaemetzincin